MDTYYYIEPTTHRPRRSLTEPEGVKAVSTFPNSVHGYYMFVRSARNKDVPNMTRPKRNQRIGYICKYD